MSARGTSSGGWIVAISRALESANCDSAQLFKDAGLDLNQASDPNSRFEVSRMRQVWQMAVEQTGNPAIGLRVAEFVKPTTFHALGYSIWASDSLRDALGRLVNYIRAVSNAGSLSEEQDGDIYRIRFQVNRDEHGQLIVAHEPLDAFVAALVSICRDLSGPDFCAARIRFERPAPDDISDFEKLFRCPLEFGAAQTMVEFHLAGLDDPLPTANAELAQQSDHILIDYIARLDQEDIVAQVRARVIEMLSAGEPPQEKVASALCLSLRNLQRKLQLEGTTYTQVVEEVRHDLAIQYLEQSHLAVNEISYLLGFSSLSSFSRAFKRWTGLAPGKYRTEKQLERS